MVKECTLLGSVANREMTSASPRRAPRDAAPRPSATSAPPPTGPVSISGAVTFQLVPGSALLAQLQQSTQPRPPWLSLWSTGDQTVQPPDSARLPGAVNVPLQSVCPGADIQHSQLPTAPLVVGLVLRALASNRLTAPPPGDCATLRSAGR